MIANPLSQSLADFSEKAAETLDRLDRTGQAEILTVNGQARAVLLSPAAYDELAREAQLSQDVAAIRQSMREIDERKGEDAEVFFDRLHAELLAMKAAGQANGATK